MHQRSDKKKWEREASSWWRQSRIVCACACVLCKRKREKGGRELEKDKEKGYNLEVGDPTIDGRVYRHGLLCGPRRCFATSWDLLGWDWDKWEQSCGMQWRADEKSFWNVLYWIRALVARFSPRPGKQHIPNKRMKRRQRNSASIVVYVLWEHMRTLILPRFKSIPDV